MRVTMGPEERAKSREVRRWTAAGPDARDNGAGRAREIQGDAQVDGGGLRLAGTVVYHEDIVAGLADAEVEHAGFADRGSGQQTVGQIGAQMFQIAAGHQGQTDLV